MTYGEIEPEQLHEKHMEGAAVELVDVRTPIEFREIHASIATNRPLSSLDPKGIMAARNGNADQPLYVICRSGSRAAKACEKFVAAGYTNVVNVEGGTSAWDTAGLPVIRGKKAISLERQVRIAAGSLVLIGALLGYFVHPNWIILPGLMGCGLAFAGITDSCALGMLLAKMPWNRCEGGGSCQA